MSCIYCEDHAPIGWLYVFSSSDMPLDNPAEFLDAEDICDKCLKIWKQTHVELVTA